MEEGWVFYLDGELVEGLSSESKMPHSVYEPAQV